MSAVRRKNAHRSISDWEKDARVTPFLPEGERGRWRVERVTVTSQDEALERIRAVVSARSRRFCPAGEYTRLMRGQTVVMSDTPDEIRDLYSLAFALARTPAAVAANGARPSPSRVLIHGLGLGCALKLTLAEPTVGHVDVVEIDPDVIALVGRHFDDERVSIVEGDAYTYRFPPGTRWDVAWHDVWDSIAADNDFATLHRRYGGRVGWQGSWCRAEAEAWRW